MLSTADRQGPPSRIRQSIRAQTSCTGMHHMGASRTLAYATQTPHTNQGSGRTGLPAHR